MNTYLFKVQNHYSPPEFISIKAKTEFEARQRIRFNLRRPIKDYRLILLYERSQTNENRN